MEFMDCEVDRRLTVSPMVNRSDIIATSAEGIVDHDRDTLLMRQLCDLLQIRHIVPRVANALEINGLGIVINGGYELLGVVTVHKLAADAQPRKHDLELVVRASVQVARRDDVVTGLSKSSNCHELSGLAGRGGNRSNTTLESSHALLEYIHGGLVVFSVSLFPQGSFEKCLTFMIRL